MTGAGGTGKTRLALALATHVSNAFADGVAFVDLSSVAEATDVASANWAPTSGVRRRRRFRRLAALSRRCWLV
jgi:predicted ATPase